MDNVAKKLFQKNVKFQESYLRRFISKLDPLGIGEGFPEDEYDYLVHSIISILNRNDYSIVIKRNLLIDKILENTDLSTNFKNEVSETVDKILQWWQNQN